MQAGEGIKFARFGEEFFQTGRGEVVEMLAADESPGGNWCSDQGDETGFDDLDNQAHLVFTADIEEIESFFSFGDQGNQEFFRAGDHGGQAEGILHGDKDGEILAQFPAADFSGFEQFGEAAQFPDFFGMDFAEIEAADWERIVVGKVFEFDAHGFNFDGDIGENDDEIGVIQFLGFEEAFGHQFPVAADPVDGEIQQMSQMVGGGHGAADEAFPFMQGEHSIEVLAVQECADPVNKYFNEDET